MKRSDWIFVVLIVLCTIALMIYTAVAAHAGPATFVSPPPLPPADGSCVWYMGALLCPPDNEPDPFRSPIPAPHCGKRYGENWCD